MPVDVLEETELLPMEGWPPEAKLILSALEAGRHAPHERRKLDRIPFRRKARISLFSDTQHADGHTIYTRDIHCRGMGFITDHRLPLGHGGVLEMIAPDGREVRVACVVSRCRQCVRGWFEGAVHYNRTQDWP